MGNSSVLQQLFPSGPLLKAIEDLTQPRLSCGTDGPSQFIKSTSSYQQATWQIYWGLAGEVVGRQRLVGRLAGWVIEHLFSQRHVLPVSRDELPHWVFHVPQRSGVLEELDGRAPTIAS